ncbi:MAG TPA: RpiB/LacA/LacB family sugar-phosphate isomerase [Solirubrobacteraceae bacterium]|nr:RpiB/LacA/LacB family sugar-phosphate isomerase [Solirubrobacteraceae bacterium]
MRISLSADELTGVAPVLAGELERRGHQLLLHGALDAARREREDWAWASETVARDVADGRAQQGIVCCWTGTGASIAANKVTGIRAALCADAATAAGARRWNDANVLALSLRSTSHAELAEILDAWFATAPSDDAQDAANVAHLAAIARTQPARTGAQPQLSVTRGREAVEFYKRALDAVEVYRVGGSDEHDAVVSQLLVGETLVWVADESPEHHNFSPQSLGGSTTRFALVVADPDAAVAKALSAGATLVRALADEHGWRIGRVVDPYGHHWEIGRPLGPWPPPAHAPAAG